MSRTKIRAEQVVEDTLEDKDGNTKVSVETSANEDKIRFSTAGAERMIITNDGKVGIGTSSPGYALDIDGDIRIRGNDIRDNSGDKVIEMDGSGFIKFTQGIKYARGVLVSSASSPAASGGNPDGGWIKFATFDCPGTSNIDTAASSFMITIAGQESSNNRALDGTFMVHAKFTVNTDGVGTDGGDVSNAYYEPEGTYIYCEPLNADRLSAAGVNAFDPSTGLIMIFTNTDSTPVVDLYIRACAKSKRCFATHLGGTGQVDTFDTDIGWTINTGQSWSATEPVAPGGSIKLTGTYASKVFSNVQTVGDLLVGGTITTTNDISFQDNGGTFPTNAAGFFWDLNNDEARIYAKQPASDQIDLVFKLSDNNADVDRFVWWIDDYRGLSYDRFPLVMHGSEALFHMEQSGEGVPDTASAKVKINNSGHIAMKVTTDPGTSSNYAHLYAKDDGGSAEVYVKDEAGNVTKISPHNDAGEWEYFSRNTMTGRVVKINMEKMVRKLEEITGESFMEEYFEN